MIRKIFTILMVLFPIFNIYNSHIATLTLSDIFLILTIGIIVIDLVKKKKSIIRINKISGVIFLYTLVQLLVIIIFGDSFYINKVTMPTVRLLVYFGTLTFFARTYFDLDYGIGFYKKVAIFVSAFLIVQIICFNLLHIYIPGTIPGLSVSEGLQNYNSLKAQGNTARFRSMFSEPAHFSTYVILALALELLAKDNKDKKAIIVMTMRFTFIWI